MADDLEAPATSGPGKVGALKVISLADHRPPVLYELAIQHFWDGSIKLWARGIALNERSNPALAAALRAYADLLDE